MKGTKKEQPEVAGIKKKITGRNKSYAEVSGGDNQSELVSSDKTSSGDDEGEADDDVSPIERVGEEGMER